MRGITRLKELLVSSKDTVNDASSSKHDGGGPTADTGPNGLLVEGDSVYGPAYFGVGRDQGGDRGGLSGYAVYDRVSSNADIAAYLLWRNFRVKRALDIGCAKGYLVEALRDLGVDAYGCDISAFAVENASSAVIARLRIGDLETGLPFRDAEFDLVTALEVLEHLHPSKVDVALGELRRVSSGVVYATIPSYGYNRSGPDGHFDGKVRPARLESYVASSDSRGGPIPFEDLAVDSTGSPVEGHLTIASFEWWTDRFLRAGFVREVEVERRLYQDIIPLGLAKFWNLYVFSTPFASRSLFEPIDPTRALHELGLAHPLVEDAVSKGLLKSDPGSTANG